ncbi:acylphosphatase [Actinomadura livida]|nr:MULTISPECIES: acylphosphatase [Actinomadura]GGT95592.1 acylphosphatase [Actinomadura livida]
MGTGDDETARLTAWVRGRVQGVGFRWWVRARALELGLAGSATNLADGRVEVVAEGPHAECRKLLDLLKGDSPAGLPGRPGKVTGVVERWSEPRGEAPGFHER